jgi:hypothetical protein
MLSEVTLESWDNCTTYALKRSGWWEFYPMFSWKDLHKHFDILPITEDLQYFKGLIVGWKRDNVINNLSVHIDEQGVITERIVHRTYHFGVVEKLDPDLYISDLTREFSYYFPQIRIRKANHSKIENTCIPPNCFLKLRK